MRQSMLPMSELRSKLNERDPPLLSDALPAFAEELQTLLTEANELDLAAQVRKLKILSRCSCGADWCATFYTRSPGQAVYNRNARALELTIRHGVVIIDVVNGKIACVEALYRDDVRKALDNVLH